VEPLSKISCVENSREGDESLHRCRSQVCTGLGHYGGLNSAVLTVDLLHLVFSCDRQIFMDSFSVSDEDSVSPDNFELTVACRRTLMLGPSTGLPIGFSVLV
jgi:hypothetical protein